jgi:general secretion pathway protein G
MERKHNFLETNLRSTDCVRSSHLSVLGFTLLEMMAVMTILIVLISLGVVRYEQSIIRAREAALSTDLRELNDAVQEFTRDKNAAPTSLDDLVSSGYVSRIPVDPITGSADWVGENCQLLDSTDQITTGICTVHSNSTKVSPFNNKPYNEWDPD